MMIKRRGSVGQNSWRAGSRFCLVALWFLLSTLSGAFALHAQGLESFIGKNVAQVRIVIEGATAAAGAGEEYRTQLLIREAEPYSVAQVHASLVSLFSSGRASNARVEAELDGNGSVVVTFIITPQARVGDIEFTGVTDLDPEDLRARLTDLERGAKYSEANVKRGAEQIYELYRDRGYYQVNVEPQMTLDPTGTEAKITYKVTPGAVATISSVTLEGQTKIPIETLALGMKSKAGVPFSRAQLNEDIRHLLDLHINAGHLDAKIGPPDVTYDDTNNTIAIRLPVTSGPIFAVRLEGYEIKDKKLREIMPFLREGGVDETSLADAARRLRSFLQEEGFFFAEVAAVSAPDPGAERAEIVFKVDSKQRYRITQIRIEGTQNLTYEDVSSELRSKTETFFPIPIFSRYTRGITSEQSLRRDADLIVSRLRDLGFRRARMASINRAVNPDNDRLAIIFNVEEGPRSHISEITFSGNALTTVEELRGMVKLNPGVPASLTQMKIAGARILQHYFDRGYALSSISTRLIDLGGERVRVVYEIREGPIVFINWVRINEIGSRQRTHSGRVEKFLHFKAGDLLKNDDLTRTEQDLYAIGAFRRILVRSEPLGAEKETGIIKRDVYVDLDEGKSRNITYGGGFQSDEGVRGIFEISDPNIFGRLTTASLRLRASQRDLLGQLSYSDPRPFGFKTPALFAVLLRRERRPAFNSRRATALFQLERRITDRSIMLLRYSYEDVRVTNPEEVTDRRDAPIRLGRIATSYAFDGRDNPFDATAGRYHSVDVSVALTALGGNEQFVRLFTENQFYRRLPYAKGTVFAGNLRLGVARSFTNRPDLSLSDVDRALLPITERFFSGGSTTLRGYDFEQAGPRDANNRPRGGNALVIVNAELRRSVYRALAMVGFYDGGNVFLTASQIKFRDITHTVGVGLRLKTPLGPFRVDFGYLVKDPLTGAALPPDALAGLRLPRRQVHFSFGQAF